MNTLRQLFLQYNAQTSDAPLLLEFERAEGVYLFDVSGKRYTDLISGIGVSNLGHGHPEIVRAVQEQAAAYMHLMVYGEYVQKPQVLLAQKIVQHLPERLNSVCFTSSGTEAAEGVMKLAKRSTGRSGIIACRGAYHGATQGALSLMGDEDYKQAFRPLLPDVGFIGFNSPADLLSITSNTAAVFVETVQGEAGVRVPDARYMQLLRRRCDETGALLVLDEIQAGCGRTGKLFAFEHFKIVPDILLLAKALGGGMPLGAFIAPGEMMGNLTHDPALGHLSTFGGHPVSCAAALAAFNILTREKTAEQAARKGKLFRQLLQHPAIREFRGLGLMMAIEFESFEQNKAVIDRCVQKGVITDWFLHDSRSMRLAPPLVISGEQIQEACKVILTAIEEVSNR